MSSRPVILETASADAAVCSFALHLQFAEATNPYFCIVQQNSPTPVRRRLFSRTQEV